MRKISYNIEKDFDQKKVKVFLKAQGVSTRLMQTLKQIPDGMLLNGRHIRTIDILREGDNLTLNIPSDEMRIEPIEMPLDIAYEDEDIIVINKPNGLAMHPTHNHQGDTLANALAAYLQSNGRSCVFRAVGRLDKCTSGLVVCALNPLSASKLSGKVQKRYYALLSKKLSGSGTIDRPIIRPDPMKTYRAVGRGGEEALTHWRAVASDEKRSLVDVSLETGRTHQIRVHFASMGAALCGDEMYGSEDLSVGRAALHCYFVELIHPVTNKKMCFSAKMPEDMLSIVNEMSKFESIHI